MIVDCSHLEAALLDAFRQGASHNDIVKILAKELPITVVSVKCAGVDKNTHELRFQVIVRVGE